MAKLPAFQFYPGDWRKDMGVQSLSFHDRGVWWEMLCLMHESERRGVLVLNGTAMGEEILARLLGLDKQILTTALTNLLTSGVASREQDTGAIYSRRMVKDEKLRKVRAESGKKGGNPALLNQTYNQTAKQNPTPSSSSSSSSSSSKQGEARPAAPTVTAYDFDADPELTIPEGMALTQYAEFILQQLHIAAGYTLRVRTGDTVALLADLEACGLPEATRRLLGRMGAAQAAGPVKWLLWLEDGHWKQAAAFSIGIEDEQ